MPAAAFVVGIAAAIAVATRVGRAYWRRRVRAWADEQGLKLLEFTGARFFEGPRAFRRSDNQFAFWVVVEDRAGEVRRGWLTFGRYWSFWPTGRPEIGWEGEPPPFSPLRDPLVLRPLHD